MIGSTGLATGPGADGDARAGGRHGRRNVLRLGLAVLIVAGLVVSAPSGFGIMWFVPYAGVGSLLVVRRPTMSIGWILLGIGWALTIATLSLDVTAQDYVDGSLDPVTAVLSVLSSSAGLAGFFLFALIAIAFPSGRLPAGRWGRIARIVVWTGLMVVVASLFMPMITVSVWGEPLALPVPNPAAVLPGLALWTVLTPDTIALILAVLMVAAALSLLVRYRRSRGIERQQLKWLASALVFVVAGVVGGFALGVLIPDLAATGLIWLGAMVAFPCIPVAIGVAVLRYRLYEIDRIVSRTVGWLALTALLAAVFVALIAGLQTILAPVTGGDTLAVAASTLAAAALFQPLRGHVQRLVDRRFNRSRIDAEAAAGAFASRLREQLDLGTLALDVTTVAYQTVRPNAVAIWLRSVPTDNSARLS